MRRTGSPQWQDGYPDRDDIARDIRRGYGHVLTSGKKIAAYAAVIFDGEPAYETIREAWSGTGPYVMVHRLAVAEQMKGRGVATSFMRQIETLALGQHAAGLRVDIHRANAYMQGMLASLIAHVLTRRHPRPRYSKGYMARLTLWGRRWLGDRLFDRILLRQLGIKNDHYTRVYNTQPPCRLHRAPEARQPTARFSSEAQTLLTAKHQVIIYECRNHLFYAARCPVPAVRMASFGSRKPDCGKAVYNHPIFKSHKQIPTYTKRTVDRSLRSFVSFSYATVALLHFFIPFSAAPRPTLAQVLILTFI